MLSASKLLWISGSVEVTISPMAQPFSRRRQASAHQPSSTLRFTTPLGQTFSPLVPLASSGLVGLLSQTSTP